MTGIALSCVLYLIVCTAITFTVPGGRARRRRTRRSRCSSDSIGAAGRALASPAFAVISTVGCLNVWVLLQGEIPLGLARAGQLPGWFGRTNAKDIAVLPLVAGVGADLRRCCWSDRIAMARALMDFMLRLTAASGLWIYAFAGCGRDEARGCGRCWRCSRLLFSLAMVVGSGTEAALLSIALMAIALPLYALTRRARR